jgi:hypothetical protein
MPVYAPLHVREALALIGLHITSSGTGRCRCCGETGPCWLRRIAMDVLYWSPLLPRRSPGATQPALINARRAA